jgi:predicted TIM-barrel fold metal-dependent hydrolase
MITDVARRFKVMDSDLHTIEPADLWDRYLDEPFKKLIPTLHADRWRSQIQPATQSGNGDGRGQRADPAIHPHYGAAASRGYDAASHLEAMDIEGVDVAVLYGTHGRHVQMRDDLDPEFAAALARAHNDWTHEYCAASRTRLKFAAQISFHDVRLAILEARRAVAQLGAVAIIGNPNPVNGRHIHDLYFEPLWTCIEELDVPMGFHPTGVWSLRDNIARRFFGHPNASTIGTAAHNPVEAMLGFASLAVGGVLERHPKLRCVFLEATCGWLPWWLWRLDETWEKFGAFDDVSLAAPPSEYFRRQCFIGTEPDEGTLRQVIDVVGADHIVFATDYPHRDGLFPEAVTRFLAQDGLTEDARAKILWDNGARLYSHAV